MSRTHLYRALGQTCPHRIMSLTRLSWVTCRAQSPATTCRIGVSRRGLLKRRHYIYIGWLFTKFDDPPQHDRGNAFSLGAFTLAHLRVLRHSRWRCIPLLGHSHTHIGLRSRLARWRVLEFNLGSSPRAISLSLDLISPA